MKYLLVFSLMLALSGCFGQARVYIVQEDNAPMQVVDERPIRVRIVDTTTQKITEVDKLVTGYFVLSPQLYRKLVKTSAQVLPEK